MKTLMLTAALALFTGVLAPRADASQTAQERVTGFVVTVRMDYSTGDVAYFLLATRGGNIGVYLQPGNPTHMRLGQQVLAAFNRGIALTIWSDGNFAQSAQASRRPHGSDNPALFTRRQHEPADNASSIDVKLDAIQPLNRIDSGKSRRGIGSPQASFTLASESRGREQEGGNAHKSMRMLPKADAPSASTGQPDALPLGGRGSSSASRPGSSQPRN